MIKRRNTRKNQKEVIQCPRINSDGRRARSQLKCRSVRIARTPWIMLPAQNSGKNIKNIATTKNPVQNECPNERYECLWWPYKTHKRKNQLTENPLITENPLKVALQLFQGCSYGIFRVALWKSSDIYRISFRIKLEFIRIIRL